MQRLKSGVKLRGVLVSTTDSAIALQLGKVVDLSRVIDGARAMFEIVDGHTVIYSKTELYELV